MRLPSIGDGSLIWLHDITFCLSSGVMSAAAVQLYCRLNLRADCVRRRSGLDSGPFDRRPIC